MDFAGWIYLVAVSALICSFCTLLIPDTVFTKHIELMICLAFLLTVLSPVAKAVKKLPSLIKIESDVIFDEGNEYNELGSEYIELKTEEIIKERIFSLIEEKTGVSAFKLIFEPSFTKGGMLDGARLICKCESPAVYTVLDIKKQQLETYLERLLICEVKIEVE